MEVKKKTPPPSPEHHGLTPPDVSKRVYYEALHGPDKALEDSRMQVLALQHAQRWIAAIVLYVLKNNPPPITRQTTAELRKIMNPDGLPTKKNRKL